jgi:hypothetical protein
MNKKFYCGDGVYAEYDGYGVWLTTENGIECTNRIYLEPQVKAALDQYLNGLASEQAVRP